MTAPDPLSSRAQALLDAARDGLGPDDAAIARMRAKVLAGAAGGAGVAAGTAATAKAGAGAGMSFGAKAAIVAVIAGAIGAGSWWMLRDAGGGAPKHEAVAAQRAKVEEAVPVVVMDRGGRDGDGDGDGLMGKGTEIEMGAEDVEPIAPSEAPPIALSEAAQPPSRRAHSDKPHGADSSLAAEVALVDEAMAALRRDDARAALAAADDHVARFGRRGQLAEEASAIRVEALCRLRDARWSAAFDAFDAQFPGSAQRPRLTAACKGVE